MDAIICKESALYYWRHHSDALYDIPSILEYSPPRKGAVTCKTPCTATLDDLHSFGIVPEEKVELLVTDQLDRRALANTSLTVCAGPFPAGSFVRARMQLYVTCPELTFLMLARTLSLIELLEVGYELCGTYRMLDDTPCYGLAPLTSAARLRTYIERASHLYGSRKAREAAQWIKDNSGSPAETAIAIVLALPYRKGGYGLDGFELNREIPLNETAAHLLGRSTVKPDEFFVESRHPIEYDSVRFHSGREQADYDERRRNAYSAMGMAVTVVRPRHLANPALFDDIVKSIRRNTGIGWNRTPEGYEVLNGRLLSDAFRYWGGLSATYGTGEAFNEQAAKWDKPELPW